MKDRYTEEPIVRILEEGEASSNKVEVCRKHGIGEGTYSRWRRQYGGLGEPEVRRLRQLEQENARLKRLLADQVLATEALREALEKRGVR
jgi:putative transposase